MKYFSHFTLYKIRAVYNIFNKSIYSIYSIFNKIDVLLSFCYFLITKFCHSHLILKIKEFLVFIILNNFWLISYLIFLINFRKLFYIFLFYFLNKTYHFFYWFQRFYILNKFLKLILYFLFVTVILPSHDEHYT